MSTIVKGAVARRAAAREQMREAILDTARAMVATEGVASLSMRAVARELGYSPAALYEYFPGKEQLCRALYCEGADGLSDRLERALAILPAGGTLLDGIKALGRAYRAYALEQPELFRLVFDSKAAGHEPDTEEIERTQQGYDVLRDAMRRAAERGLLVDVPPDALAVAAWAAVHGFVTLELAGVLDKNAKGLANGDGALVAALFEVLLDAVLYGLTRR
jgi:AcrR family transcriptional regulator